MARMVVLTDAAIWEGRFDTNDFLGTVRVRDGLRLRRDKFELVQSVRTVQARGKEGVG